MSPLRRRDFLRTSAGIGLTVPLAVAVQQGGAIATPAAGGPSYSTAVPANWTYPMVAALLPFGHGVASGDPLSDRVILWTRITIPDERGWDATLVANPQGFTSVAVAWRVATDPGMASIIASGTVVTDATRDWTVKVDATGLPANSVLFYCFEALGFRSPIGRTRTAPTPGGPAQPLTVANVACSSWWQDMFNGYHRIADRNDIDLITHAGDYVYNSSGGHPASRFYRNQTAWDTDLDNKDWSTVAECRRRYALYRADEGMIRAHHSAPWAVMADNHEFEGNGFSGAAAGEVFHEWVPIRPVNPDGSGQFLPSPGANTNVPIPRGDAARYLYRSLPWGSTMTVVLIDRLRFNGEAADPDAQMLGDKQWAWLESTLRGSTGSAFRLIVNGANLGQLRAFNLPNVPGFSEFGIDPNLPQGELYTSGWGSHPAERTRLMQFLRAEGIKDNVVHSGDSHGFFGNDLVEDPMPPAYEPLTGGGTLGAVGVEMVTGTFGRPGGEDVVAEAIATQNTRGAMFTDASTYDTVYRPEGAAAMAAAEPAARVANPHLQFFDWHTPSGFSVMQFTAAAATIEAWSTPQRVISGDSTLLAQFVSPAGAPHLGQVLLPTAVTGTARTPVPTATVAALPGSAASPTPTASPSPTPVAPSTPPRRRTWIRTRRVGRNLIVRVVARGQRPTHGLVTLQSAELGYSKTQRTKQEFAVFRLPKGASGQKFNASYGGDPHSAPVTKTIRIR